MMQLWMWPVLGGLAIFVVHQQVRMLRIRSQAKKREELFQIVTENAADMIALVDVKGQRLYNSPAYKRILGYSPAELGETSAFEQIHPDDRFRVLEAAREARRTGVGQTLEYRIRHKNGNWRVLESTASTIRDSNGEVAKLVIVNRDVTERKQAQEQLEHNLFHDVLTGLPNRRLFLDRLEHLFTRAAREPQSGYALLLIDLDRYKSVNEALGTAAGDELLREIGRRIADSLRREDTVGRSQGVLSATDPFVSRLGGDEFVVLLDKVATASDAMRIARRIQTGVAEPYVVGTQNARTCASVGIALSCNTHARAEDLLHDAEAALRRAKAMGGSRSEVFDHAMHAQAEGRLKLESDLRTAIGKQQFRVYYQPIVNLARMDVEGFEALLRWEHPEKGLISPMQFLEAAEDTGLLVSIGEWLVGEACKQQAEWQTQTPLQSPVSVTVNLSARQFADPALVAYLRRTMQETGADPSRLRVEIIESVIANDGNGASTLTQLRQLGVRAILDNFGIGYCSLNQFRRLPVEGVKIDRSLVAEMLGDRSAFDMVELLILVAHKLGLRVLAEGIESAVHVERLRELGCDSGQGYWFSLPLARDAAEQWLRSWPARQRAYRAKA